MKPIKIKKESLGKYAVAPYNFVSLPEKAHVRYRDISELPKHDSYKDKNGKILLNGCIKYKLRAETPIIVSEGIDKNNKSAKFFTNAKEEYVIPGSSVKGMVKANAYILSYSSVVGNTNDKNQYEESTIEDSTFLFRDVASNNSLSQKYRNLLGINRNTRIAERIKAGIMINKKGKLYIEPAEELIESKSYFRVDELELRKGMISEDLKGINYMYNKDGNKYNEKYAPYSVEISFEYDKAKAKIIRIGRPGKYKNEGYILSGGYIRGKRSHYVVPKSKNNGEFIKIPEKQKEEYIDDLILTKKAKKDCSEKAKNSYWEIESRYSYWDLPKNEEKKPVFYIIINGKLHFSFTPYLRLSYEKSVLDGVGKGYKDVDGISYVDSMFGFSNKKIKEEKVSYKSRISFEDAVVIGNAEVDKESSIKILLAQPKPTSCNLYLVQEEDKKQLNIYDGDFRIRGIKQYWLKDYVEKPDIENNMTFTVNPLKEGTCFEGTIYFNNLYEDELGLLLWSLKLNEECYQTIGQGKPYGFGRVKVYDIELNIEDIDKKYSSFSFNYAYKEDINKYINFYKNYFSSNILKGKIIDEEKPVKELMHIKSKIVKADEANRYRYMDLKEFRGEKFLRDILHYDENKRVKNLGKTDGTKSKRQNSKKTVKRNKNSLINTALADQLEKIKDSILE